MEGFRQVAAHLLPLLAYSQERIYAWIRRRNERPGAPGDVRELAGMKRLRLRQASAPWREIGGEVLALDIESSSYLGTNAAGSLLWKLLAEGATREELVQGLVDEFEIGAETAGDDVDLFLAELAARGLLEA